MTNATTLTAKTVKSYKTESNLEEALNKAGLINHRHIRVMVKDHDEHFELPARWTAVFPASNLSGPSAILEIQGDMAFYARKGFYTLG